MPPPRLTCTATSSQPDRRRGGIGRRRRGPGDGRVYGLHLWARRGWVRVGADPRRRRRRHDCRCDRGSDHADLPCLLRCDQGDNQPQRHPRDGLAAVRRKPQRLRSRRGLCRARTRGVGSSESAGRPRLRRDRRLCDEVERIPHDRTKPDGREMAEAIRVALAQARLEPTAVAYINAHGSGTKQNDRHETAAFKLALGDHAYRVPVSSIKSMIGHSLGAIGSIEIAACALAIDRGVVPPTANLQTRPGVRLGLRAARRAGARDRCRSHRRQRVRWLPERDGARKTGEALVTSAIVTGLGVIAPSGIEPRRTGRRPSQGRTRLATSRGSTRRRIPPVSPVRCATSTRPSTSRAGCCHRPTK